MEKANNSNLDLAFAMDCTGSMGPYIDSARNNIRLIVEEIIRSERSQMRLALVEYRDHPPQVSDISYIEEKTCDRYHETLGNHFCYACT